MEERLSNGAPDRFVGPIRVSSAKRGGLELPRRVVQPLGGLQLLGRRHGPQDAKRLRVHFDARSSHRCVRAMGGITLQPNENFGEPTSRNALATPRNFQLSAVLRF